MTRKLHIGGAQRTDGWEVLNAIMGPHVDHHGNAKDLSCFDDETFAEIYASHVLEHFDYKNELLQTLKEWKRVLIPGGKIYISVPDLDILATIFMQKDILTADERFHVMRMMFGGHVNEWDYHVVGLNDVFLSSYLTMAGFVNTRRVDNFSIFNDTSCMLYKGVAISLNMIAEKALDKEMDEPTTAQASSVNTFISDINSELQKAHAHHHNGEYDLARKGYERILQVDPHHPDALHLIGTIELVLGNNEKAETYIRRALAINDQEPIFCNNLGTALLRQGSHREAIESFKRALSFSPDYASAHLNLGTALKEIGHLSLAAAHFAKTLKLTPDSAEAYYNLGTVYQDQAKLNKAVAAYQKALQLKPSFKKAQSNFLFSTNYLPNLSPEQVADLHKAWGQDLSVRETSIKSGDTRREKGPRRVRIGYVSPDFRRHSVAFFMLPLIEHHDRNRFEVFLYSDAHTPDAITAAFKSSADRWRNIQGIRDIEVTTLIQEDEIDILVDLAGHTGNSRMIVFAQKPAPVQVSYLGYPNTTGLQSMDYRLTDNLADPEGMTGHLFTEKLIRLPQSFLCYRNLNKSPEINDLPALNNGRVTFGSFNTGMKINDNVIDLWSRILRTVPMSLLLLKAKHFRDGEIVIEWQKRFAEKGISTEQLKLVGYIYSDLGHLQLYNDVDIALDTFPYNGTTTTCEALWMGVPVITLTGNHHASRVGTSILSTIGLTDCITASPEAYVQKAVDMAGDLEELSKLRRSLKQRLLSSPITDEGRFTQNLENIYLQMYKTKFQDL